MNIKQNDNGKWCLYGADGQMIGEFDSEEAAQAEMSRLSESHASRPSPDAFLVEAVGAEGKVWDVAVIAAGYSANRAGGAQRYYPREVIASAVPLVEGSRVYAHSTSNSLSDEHEDPSRASPRDVVGWLAEARMVGDQLRAKFHVTADWLREALIAGWQAGKKDLYGLSITGAGPSRRGKVGGADAMIVEAIKSLAFVSLVTRPAAGGAFINLIESTQSEKKGVRMDRKKALAAIRKARPELLASLNESELTEEQIAGLLIEACAADSSAKDNGQGNEALTEAKKLLDETKKAQCAILLESKMMAAKLPEPVVAVLAKRFKNKIFESSELDEAIKEQKELLDKLAESGQVRGAGETRVEVTKDLRDKWQDSMDNMMSRDPNKHRKGFHSLHESWREIAGRGVEFDPHRLLHEAVVYAPRISDKWQDLPRLSESLRESLKTSDWGEVFNASMYKQMIGAYDTEDYQKWRGMVSTYSNLTNFQTLRRVRYGGYGRLPTVAEQGTYQPLTSPTDEEATFAPSKRGGLEDLTWEMILNDDLGAVRDVPNRLGLAAIMTLYLEMIELFTANAAIYDAVALFHSGSHGNDGSGAALAASTLKSAILAMRDQTAFGNSIQVLGSVNAPKRLWVPNELQDVAFKLINSNVDVGAASEAGTTPNVIKGAYNIEVVVIDDWTDANDWFLTADPARMPLVEVGFLNGQEQPELFVQDMPNIGSMFNADKITYKIRHVHGKVIRDYRGFSRRQG